MDVRFLLVILAAVCEVKFGHAVYCDREVPLPEVTKVVKGAAGLRGSSDIIFTVKTIFVDVKAAWFTKSTETEERFLPIDIKDNFQTTETLGNEIGIKQHQFGLHVTSMSYPELKMWENVYMYLMLQDECHNIHVFLSVVDSLKIVATEGSLRIPTITRAPFRRYFPTIGSGFNMKIEVAGTFGASYVDLQDMSALQENRIHAAYPGYSFFEKAFWSNGQEFGVKFRSGDAWKSWEEQYPKTRPGNVQIAKKKFNENGQTYDRRMAVFDPFTQDDVGLYETRLKVGLQEHRIEIRIYCELTVSGSSQSDFAVFPSLSFLPCDLYPSVVDTERQEIHPDSATLNLGVPKPAINAGAEWACLLQLVPTKKRASLTLKDDNKGTTVTPAVLAEIDYGTFVGAYYKLPAPPVGGRINYTYEDDVRTEKITVGSYRPMKMALQPTEIDYEKQKGKDVKIKCSATAVPLPTVMFKRKLMSGAFQPMVGDRYKTRVKINIKRNTAKATLTINNFSYVDAFPPYEWGARGFMRTGVDKSKGNYGIYCFADNGYTKVAEIVSVDHGKEEMMENNILDNNIELN